MPQLSGGEFGWAVDTQQLYIGNGSVAEGAPYVGNTEILTTGSNIFELLGSYTYKGHSLVVPQTNYSRTLQQKLDDFLSIKDFGVTDNTDTEQTVSQRTVAMQRAIDQIFLNTDKNNPLSRRTLMIPAGIYEIDTVLRIPSYATIVGEGKDKTVILQKTQTQSAIQTIATNSSIGNYVTLNDMTGSTFPREVQIAGISFRRDSNATTATPIAVLDCLANSSISSCEFVGSWTNNSAPGTGGANSSIQIRSKSTVSTNHLTFRDCSFTKTAYAVYSDYESDNIRFENCKFTTLYRGLSLAENSNGTGGQAVAPTHYTVEDSVFTDIDAEAWKVFNTIGGGVGHVSKNNKFYDVGNNNQGQGNPAVPVLDFRTEYCQSIGDYFERNASVNDSAATGVAYVPDVLGPEHITYATRQGVLIYNTPTNAPKTLCKIPLWSNVKVVIDYVIRKPSSSIYRAGRIEALAHPDMAVLNSSVLPVIKDQFSYVGGSEGTSVGPLLGGNINFTVSTAQLLARTLTLNDAPITRPTLLVRYANPTGPGGNATIDYTVTIYSSNTVI